MPAQGSTPGSVGVDASFEDNLLFVLSWTPNTTFSSSNETKTKSQKVITSSKQNCGVSSACLYCN